MSKKQWIITAAVVLAVVVVMSIFYVPRKLERIMELPDAEPVFISGHISGDVHEPLVSYKTEDAQAMAQFLSALREERARYINGKNIYRTGEVSADVLVHYADGSICRVFISDNGTVRCGDRNYFCEDGAALKELLVQIESWELYHESKP